MPKKQNQTIGSVLLQGYRCRCGHEWLPRNKAERPRVCPSCKSPNWDRLKLNMGKKAEVRKASEQDRELEGTEASE
jgi:predicted Zn-ribbon and HTH transcriptional regulator